MDSKNNLQKLQAILASNQLDGCLFSTQDEYLSEYVAPYAKRLEWLSNFSGSYGIVVVTLQNACLFVDSRYTLQANYEVTTLEIQELNFANIIDWINAHLEPSDNIGFYTKSVSYVEYQYYTQHLKNYNLITLDQHLIDHIWQDQPHKYYGEIKYYGEQWGSDKVATKIQSTITQMQAYHADYYLITALDSIAWLLNLRGNDIKFNPLFFAKCLVDKYGNIILFCNHTSMNIQLSHLDNITVYNEQQFKNYVKQHCQDHKILFYHLSPYYYYQLLQTITKHIINIDQDIIINLKAKKTPQELNTLAKLHLQEGAVLTKILQYVKTNYLTLDEIAIDQLISNEKSQINNYLYDSFPSIIGADDHSSIVHYRANPATNVILKEKKYLLIDCGSQYHNGTTDMTRSISLTSATEEYKNIYTLVIKAHIAVANCIFKAHVTKGSMLDFLARQTLWQYGYDYGHGTGHGVGFALCVHESGISLSPNNQNILQEGMVISNEPGCYLENKFGIRLENLYYIKKHQHHHNYLVLQCLTYVPFEMQNILFNMLTINEQEWLKQYNKDLIQYLSPYLDQQQQQWLVNYVYQQD